MIHAELRDQSDEATGRAVALCARPLLAYLAVGVVLWCAVGWSAAHFHRVGLHEQPVETPGGALVEGWIRWDAFWYRSIAEEGYLYFPDVQSSVAFFPAYPLTMRLLGPVTPSPFVAGILVTIVSGASGAVLFWCWARRRMMSAAASSALAALLVYPFGWYLYGAIYADALFLAVTIGAFVALEKDRYWLAGVLGLVASAARPPGIAVAICLVLRLLERRNEVRELVAEAEQVTRLASQCAAGGSAVLTDAPPRRVGARGFRAFIAQIRTRFSPRALRWSDAPIALAFAGFGSYCTYLWLAFGNPFLFAQIQGVKGWDQPADPHTWFKVAVLNKLTTDPFSDASLLMLTQAMLTLTFLALVPKVARRFGWAYGVLTLMVVALPAVGSKDFIGLGRYLLAAFPVFALTGEWLSQRSPWLRRSLLAVCFVLLVWLASLFGRGYYLS
ncbi:MAG: hypothetical protein N2037_02290 [Acidimicrobiales bacterium]|nr:hypothetical protein [Acidimicrobiales bacterium]